MLSETSCIMKLSEDALTNTRTPSLGHPCSEESDNHVPGHYVRYLPDRSGLTMAAIPNSTSIKILPVTREAILVPHRPCGRAGGYRGGRGRGSLLRAGVMGALVGALIVPRQGVAQTMTVESGANPWQVPGYARLTVRPREMIQPTTNPPAGVYVLDSVPDYWVTVPPQCAGAHRCPLWVFLPNGNSDAQYIAEEIGPPAIHNGIILLTLTAYYPKFLDAGLKEVFQGFAIDLDRVAISGHCASSDVAMRFAVDNVGLFSRALGISPFVANLAGLDPKDKRLQLFGDDGLAEGGHDDEVELARARGYSVKRVTGWRRHELQFENEAFLGYLLQQSWAIPDPANWPKPQVVAEPLPELTSEAIQRLTTFWTKFMQEPDSIRITARRAHLREVALPGRNAASLPMADMPALAARYPSVAAALTQAGLTAEQHDAYRVAVAATVSPWKGVPLTPTLAKNLEFVKAHPDEMNALWDSGMFWTP